MEMGVSPVYENFLALPQEKQKRIRNAAFREFGRYGYRKTAAEQVAQSAGIAKGMVFHYFGSKQGLYEYLAGYCGEVFYRWFGNLGDELAGLDFIEQYRRTTKIKLKVFTEEPCVFEFFTMLFMHPENQAVSPAVEAVYQRFIALRMQTLAGIRGAESTHRFRADIDPEKAEKYVRWLIDGYAQEMMAVFSRQPLADMDLDRYWVEFDEILEDLKRLFYANKQPPEQED